MELTYWWSIVLLGCIFLDWALLASAEEGKCEPFKKKKSCLDMFFSLPVVVYDRK